MIKFENIGGDLILAKLNQEHKKVKKKKIKKTN